MGRTKIAWSEYSWNPLRGCTRVSAGCKNCYAERIAGRFSGSGLAYEGFARMTEAGPRWTGKVELVERRLGDPISWKTPRLIFVNSTSDLFHEKVSDETLWKIFDVIKAAPQHVYQILTKRAERMELFLSKIKPGDEDIFDLCLFGVSAEDQENADRRVNVLLRSRAKYRWVSYEPALGPIDFEGQGRNWLSFSGWATSLDWIVVGGESGVGARPFDPNWARSVRNQCETHGVPFFMKQVGGTGRDLDALEAIPEDLRIRQYPKWVQPYPKRVQ